MKIFITTLQAIDKSDGLIKTFIGTEILANNWTESEQICKEQYPYLSIHGEKICEFSMEGKLINVNLN